MVKALGPDDIPGNVIRRIALKYTRWFMKILKIVVYWLLSYGMEDCETC